MKKITAVLGVLGLLAFAVPVFAQYAPTYPYPTPAPAHSCSSLSYNLYRGLSDYYTGGQVSQLQQFLSARGYYQPVTGYYGAITWSNVAQFQRQQAVYPITGGVGPLTRAAIARVCGGAPNNSALFSAYPTSGQAPLAVAFSVNSVGGYETSRLSIDFGDGQTGTPQTIYCFAAPCNPAMTASHTYAAPGTYTARLMYQPPFYCPPGLYCAQVMPAPQVVGSVTITVQ